MLVSPVPGCLGLPGRSPLAGLLERLTAAVDLLCPQACFRCGVGLGSDSALCPACCGAIVAPPATFPTGLDGCAAGAVYSGEVEAWVRAFKYPAASAFPDPGPEAILVELILRAARNWPGPLPDRIVPIPLHRRRLRSRGFNPAGRLGRLLARRLAVEFDPVALERTRDTPSQTGLDARARRRNLAGAFRLARRAPPPPRIWLVDDVVTTGATLSAAARPLRAAGAREIVAICAAATPRPRRR